MLSHLQLVGRAIIFSQQLKYCRFKLSFSPSKPPDRPTIGFLPFGVDSWKYIPRGESFLHVCSAGSDYSAF